MSKALPPLAQLEVFALIRIDFPSVPSVPFWPGAPSCPSRPLTPSVPLKPGAPSCPSKPFAPSEPLAPCIVITSQPVVLQTWNWLSAST